MTHMTIEKSNKQSSLRIEAVDHWHKAWESVRAHIDATGKAKKLRIDADGWLSARQVLMVAFVAGKPVAHVCFSIAPAKNSCIEARLDSHGINARFCGRGIESQLHQAAVDRAKALRCAKLSGFKLSSNWC